MLRRIGTSVACMLVAASCLLSSGNAFAQGSPTDLAENNFERFAYINAYCSRVIAQPLPETLAESGASSYSIELAVEGILHSEVAFQSCLKALETDNNQLWYWAWTRSLQAQKTLEELHEITGNVSAATAASYSKWAAEDALDAFIESGASLPTNTYNRRVGR
jgi:hypothetical protein